MKLELTRHGNRDSVHVCVRNRFDRSLLCIKTLLQTSQWIVRKRHLRERGALQELSGVVVVWWCLRYIYS